MIIYWMLLFVCPLLALMAHAMPQRVYGSSGVVSLEPNRLWAFLAMFVIAFFSGMRSGILDTNTYIGIFNWLPADVLEDIWTSEVRDKGFTVFTYIMKYYVYDDFHVWLFTIAAFSCYAVGKTFYRYSPNYALSIFLFVATTQFTWMLNGMRQYLAAATLFMCFHMVFNKKKHMLFILIALILATFHGSAIFMIPIYFMCNSKPFSLWHTLVLLGFVLAAIYMNEFLGTFDSLLSDTQYSNYSDFIREREGSNIFRLIVAAIPPLLCLWKYKKVKEINDTVMNFCINMSMYNLGIMILANTIGGLYFGRMAVYCSIFNLLLYPMIGDKLFRGVERKLLYLGMIIGYIGWFYYQINIVANMSYVSDILGLDFYPIDFFK